MNKTDLKSRDPAAATLAELKRTLGIADRPDDWGRALAPLSEFERSQYDIIADDRAARRGHLLLRGIIIGLALIIAFSLLAAMIE